MSELPEDKIEKIEKVSSGEAKQGIAEEPVERVAPNKEHFDSLLQQKDSATLVPAPEAAANKLTLMDTVRDLNYSGAKKGPVTHDSLIVQTKDTIAQIEEVKGLLSSSDIHLKSSVQQLLHNKLTHIDDNLRVALSKAGVEFEAPTNAASSGRVNPIERFLGFLTDGEFQLQRLGGELSVMAARNHDLSPTSMLAIQVKVNQIQQELELFTSLLSKALESIKTIMNIQV